MQKTKTILHTKKLSIFFKQRILTSSRELKLSTASASIGGCFAFAASSKADKLLMSAKRNGRGKYRGWVVKIGGGGLSIQDRGWLEQKGLAGWSGGKARLVCPVSPLYL